ncbi:polysaccharide deacetylase family protein [candidate division KSB1 bacterium]|nr:polysaccharide deacetylase family protein [candidate division KSB1 bacterium]
MKPAKRFKSARSVSHLGKQTKKKSNNAQRQTIKKVMTWARKRCHDSIVGRIYLVILMLTHPVVLSYHLVDRRFDFGITWVTPRQFERQVAWLAEDGYRTLSLSACLQSEFQLPPKAVVLTFDDGFRALMKHVLPVLERYGFVATVFPVAGYVGEQNRWDYNLFWRRMWHLDWNELRELLAAGWEVGSHSMRHAYLPSLSRAELLHDLRQSKERLEQNLQIPIHHLSLPFGRGNLRVLECALDAGYASVATLGQEFDLADSSLSGISADRRLRLFSRRGIYLHDTLRSFRRRVQAPMNSQSERLRQQAISVFSYGTVLLKALRQSQHCEKSLEI